MHFIGNNARVASKVRLNSKIKSILTVKKPLICEILMDPNEEQIPKAINKKNKDGKSIPTVFEDMYPFLSRSDFQKMNIDNYEK